MGSKYTKFTAYTANDSAHDVEKKHQQNAYASVERAMDGVEGYELDSSYDEAKKKGILAVYDQYYKEHYADLGMPTTGKTYAEENGSSSGSGSFGGSYSSGVGVYDRFQDSAYMEALNALKNAQSNLPVYKNSYEDEIREVYDRIVNREKFSYDVNADALYQQYKDQYVSLGKLAMQDTMGQAAAMTGGYGNSYAASVGNQAYQSYLSQLNQVVPELYGMAYDRYRQEGQDMLNQYSMLGDMRDTEYNQYLNELNQYWNNVNYHKQLLDDAYNQGYTANRDAYNQYIDERNFAYQQQQDALAQQNYLNEFEYKKAQDAIAQQNFEKEFDYKKWQDSIAIDQWNQSFAHQVEQDKIAEDQWNQSFAHEVAQDKIAEDQWNQSFAHDVAQDKIAEDQWNQSFAHEVAQDAIAQQQWKEAFDLDVYKTDLEQYNIEQERMTEQQEKYYDYLIDMLESGYTPTQQDFENAGLSDSQVQALKNKYGISSESGFSGTTYEEALSYMRSNGVSNDSAIGLMTKSEWNDRKHSSSPGKEAQYDSYEEYLKAYVDSRITQIGNEVTAIGNAAPVEVTAIGNTAPAEETLQEKKPYKPAGGPRKPVMKVQLY